MKISQKGLAIPERPNQSHRERDDTYRDVMLERGCWRLIRCKDGIQWIIQNRAPGCLRSNGWRGISFHLHRESLIRDWRRLSGWDGLELMALPEVCRREAK